MNRRMMQFCAGLCACVFAGEAWGYAPGDGTGLRAQVVGPVNGDAYAPTTFDQFNVCETQEFANVALDRNTTLFSDGTARCSVLNWRGKLIVPETANYTFTATMRDYSYDGFRLVIDGVELFNQGKVPQRTGGAVVAATSPTELTAGEHAIEVDYAANSKTILKCILSWQNDASIDAPEVIPQTQFKPAATDVFPAYVYGDLNAVWSGRAVGGKFFNPRQVGPSSFALNNWAANGANGSYTSSCIGRMMDGFFRAEITYDMTDTTKPRYDGAFLYMASSTNAGTYFTCRMLRRSDSQINYCLKASAPQGELKDVEVNSGSTGSSLMRMRIERDPLGRLGCYYRELPDGEWKLGFQYDRDGHWLNGRTSTADIATYPDRVFVGFGVTDGTSAQVDDVEFSNPLFAPVSFEVVADKATAGATLTWSNAANQVSFKVKYRCVESNDWITAAEDLPPETETYRLTEGLKTYVSYEVKVVAVGADGEELESETLPFTCGETGLYGAVMGPVQFNAYSHDMENQCMVRETRLFAEPYLNLESGVSLFESTNFVNGVVCWRGSLDVPADGTYDFQLLCNEGNRNQGSRLAIDGTNYVNNRIYANNVSSASASVALTKGLHALEIDFGSFNKSAGVKHFEIRWRMPGREDFVRMPSSCFRPTGEPENLPRYSMDGFEYRFPGSGGKGARWTTIRKTDDGAYELKDANPANFGFGGYTRATFGKKVKGPFSATFSLNWAKVPAAATSSSPSIALSVLYPTDANDHQLHFGLDGAILKLSGSKSAADITNVANIDTKGVTKKDWIRFKVVRKADNRIVCKYSTRNAGESWSPWKEGFVYDGDKYQGTVHGDLTADSLFVGVTSSMVEPQKVYDFQIMSPLPGLVLLVR